MSQIRWVVLGALVLLTGLLPPSLASASLGAQSCRLVLGPHWEGTRQLIQADGAHSGGFGRSHRPHPLSSGSSGRRALLVCRSRSHLLLRPPSQLLRPIFDLSPVWWVARCLLVLFLFLGESQLRFSRGGHHRFRLLASQGLPQRDLSSSSVSPSV
jgi:hypothetical protein